MDFGCCPRDLCFVQGSQPRGEIIFGHGPVYDLSTFDGANALLRQAGHCIDDGDHVHVVAVDSCQQVHNATYAVDVVAGASLELTLVCGNALTTPGIVAGYITKAMNLVGFCLRGAIKTAMDGDRGFGRAATAAQGQDLIAINGVVDVRIGDVVSFPNAGLIDAKVIGIYETEPCPRQPAQTLLHLDATASQTVARGSFELKAAPLVAFRFQMAPECGRATYFFDGSLPGFSVPGDCQSDCIRIGCYEIVLEAKISGRWRQVIARGAAYITPSLLTEK